MNKTHRPSQEQIKRAWHLIDAKEEVLGRMATRIANILQGKTKSIFSRDIDCGDYVVVLNAKEVKTTGNKAQYKSYFSHSGYIGSAKFTAFKDLLKSQPEKIIYFTVSGMLPKNKLRSRFLKRLKIFPGSTHAHTSQIKTEK